MPQYNRSGHRLRRNHSNALPRYLIAVDTETLPQENESMPGRRTHRFRLGVAITTRIKGISPVGTREHNLHSTDCFWKLLEKTSASNYTTWIVCHNALFDMVVLGMPEQFERGKLVIEWPRSDRKREDNSEDNAHARTIAIIDSPPTIIAAKYVPTGGRIVIVDTLNWFPTSLSRLGDACGRYKMPMPSFSDDNDTWRRYCSNDAYICFETFIKLIQWVRELDMGMFRYTAPSQSMSAYRHRFMRHQIFVHDNIEVKKLERDGYFGGRTEVFKSGKINRQVHQLDVNSLFPSVMLYETFPSKLIEYSMDVFSYPHDLLFDYKSCVAEVLLRTDKPLFPFRIKKSVIYPTGELWTTLSGAELELAASSGSVIKIGKWARYDLKPIFVDWVTELWRLRKEYQREGNLLYCKFTKRLMNSLYGKFGQRSPEWINVQDVNCALPWSSWTDLNTVTQERTAYRSFGWQVQKCCDKGEISGTFVAISAFVSAAARCRMNDLRKIAGIKNVYYQGVDSLIVTDDGLSNLSDAGQVDEEQIGKLRLQLSTNHGEILGCNDYAIEDKIVISGRSLNNKMIADGGTLQQSFAVASDLFSGVTIDSVEERWMPWNRVSACHKGSVGQDGWIEPFVVGMPASGSIGGDSAAI